MPEPTSRCGTFKSQPSKPRHRSVLCRQVPAGRYKFTFPYNAEAYCKCTIVLRGSASVEELKERTKSRGLSLLVGCPPMGVAVQSKSRSVCEANGYCRTCSDYRLFDATKMNSDFNKRRYIFFIKPRWSEVDV